MSYRNYFWFLVLLLAAFALRLFRLEFQSIWWDEGISLHLATSEYGEIVRDRLSNIHPPLYFFGLKVWFNLVGVNVFTARYMSLLAGWLQVAAVIGVARRWFGLKTAYAAGISAAVFAVSVIYSQEIRVYSILPLIYLALLAVTRELTQKKRMETGGTTLLWSFLVLVTWVGLHLHYITVVVVAYITVWALIVFNKNRCRLCFRRWLLIQFLTLLACLPWFMAVFRNWTTVNAEANAGTFMTDPVPLLFLISQVWAFHLTGLAGILARPGVLVLAGIVAGVLVLLLIVRLAQRETRRDAAVLMLHWLVPLSSALLVWTVRSFSHPRYVALFVPGLILLTAFLVSPPQKPGRIVGKTLAYLFSLLLLSGLLLASLWGLWLYFFDPGVAKDDMRGVARYLEESAGSADLILVPDTDWSLPFEYKGEALIAMPHLDGWDGGWSNLADLTANAQRVFVVDYLEGTRDWQDKVPFSLAQAGYQVAEKEFDGLVVRAYRLEEPVSEPQMDPTAVNFNPLQLTGVWIEQDARAGDNLAVALMWHVRGSLANQAHAALRLMDPSGWQVASSDLLLRDANGRPTNQWPSGENIITYHLLSLPQALPPLAYELGLQIYLDEDGGIKPLDILDEQGAPMGQDAVVGQAHISNAPDSESFAPNDLPLTPRSETLDLGSGLSLLAAEVQEGPFRPGERIDVQLLWQSSAESLDNLQPQIALVQNNIDFDVSVGTPVNGRYPTNFWREGEKVYEHRQINIPLRASGMFQIIVRLENNEILVAEVEVQEVDHVFESPPVIYMVDDQFGEIARLVGFNLAKEVYSADESIPLTLVWQSIIDGSEIDYVVFAHLLAEDGHLIGQHDSPPGNGARKTTGWVMDEYVLDPHEIALKEKYIGQATIEIGVYDPVSGQRLLTPDGADHLILPAAITIVP